MQSACKALQEIAHDFVYVLQAVESLSAVEKEVLMPRLAKLRAQLQPGFTSLIWSSLTTDSFIQQAEKVCPRY